jgi:hypothetical protein
MIILWNYEFTGVYFINVESQNGGLAYPYIILSKVVKI